MRKTPLKKTWPAKPGKPKKRKWRKNRWSSTGSSRIFKKQKETWEKEHVTQQKKREKLTVECAARRGIINEYGYCDCREHEQWNSDRSACVCVRGYSLNRATDRCEPCDLVNTYGACTDACRADEKKVRSWKGPNKYICVKKCSKNNEVWSDRKNTCVCKDGYSRDEKGECVPRK